MTKPTPAQKTQHKHYIAMLKTQDIARATLAKVKEGK